MGKRYSLLVLLGTFILIVSLPGRAATSAAAAQGDGPLNASISVSPETLEAQLTLGGSATLPLTISNTGNSTLEWTLAEEAVAGEGQEGGGGPAAPQVLLYDQSDAAGTVPILSQEFQETLSIFTSQAADDFFIAEPTGWTIETVVVAGAYYNGPGPTPFVNVMFYSDNTGVPGDPIYLYDGLTTFTDVAGDFTIDLSSSPAVLPPGNYWVSVQADMDFEPSGQWGWTERLVPTGSLSVWRNPGNGYGTNCTNWMPREFCGIGTEPDHVFQLHGVVGGALVPCIPANVTWLSASPAAGAVEPGGSETVYVTMNAGGLTPGIRGATLCIANNDPLNPVVRVPVTMEILPPVPAISLAKTVGRDPGACATSDEVTVGAGEQVTYCYRVTNTGSVALGVHDLVDDHLGTLLDGLGFGLVPGASIFITETAVISLTTTNSAVWTAYNPGGIDLVDSQDTAVVSVGTAPQIDVQPATLGSSQPTGLQVDVSLTIANAGNANLEWSLVEESGSLGRAVTPTPVPLLPQGQCVPGTVSWLAATPSSGLVGPYGSNTVQVTFDSAGLGTGFYNATLCLTSNDVSDPTVRVPVTLQVIATPTPAIALGLTVGLQPNACSGTPSLVLPAEGGNVTYCYWVQNTGNVSLNVHDLVDSAAGTLLTDYPYQLNPGASLALLWAREIDQTTVNQATWTAWLTTGVGATDDALAVVTVLADDGRRSLLPTMRRP
jgi:hypothetical protein